MFKALSFARAVTCVLFLSVLMVSACGEGESASEKCDAFFERYCERNVECIGSSEFTYQDCREAVITRVNCGEVVAVTDQHDRCVSEFEQLSCEALDLPASCNGVLLTVD